MSLTADQKARKLQELVESEGFPDLEAMLAACVADSIAPAICINPDCDYTAEMEPDQRAGYCEVCGGQSVQSALVLASII